MPDKNSLTYFRRALLDWFPVNGRAFPWRDEEVTNYELIISEILLQRTRAESVARYYGTFFGAYPDWESLAGAGLEELEEILRPLGLYRHRARRLYRIIEEYRESRGVMPANRNQLQESNLAALYLSNAYELFVLKHRSALLDVNMSRVFSRYFNVQHEKDVRHNREMRELARVVTNVKRCRELNWAILDFAALVCRPTKPKCEGCVLRKKCAYYHLVKAPVNQHEMGQDYP